MRREIDEQLEREVGRGLKEWADNLRESEEADLRATLAATCGELFRRGGPALPRDLRQLADIFDKALRRAAN